jgi:hypothetical protein
VWGQTRCMRSYRMRKVRKDSEAIQMDSLLQERSAPHSLEYFPLLSSNGFNVRLKVEAGNLLPAG